MNRYLFIQDKWRLAEMRELCHGDGVVVEVVAEVVATR
jgi:hypothetical protein